MLRQRAGTRVRNRGRPTTLFQLMNAASTFDADWHVLRIEHDDDSRTVWNEFHVYQSDLHVTLDNNQLQNLQRHKQSIIDRISSNMDHHCEIEDRRLKFCSIPLTRTTAALHHLRYISRFCAAEEDLVSSSSSHPIGGHVHLH
jgi:hypothetical protein